MLSCIIDPKEDECKENQIQGDVLVEEQVLGIGDMQQKMLDDSNYDKMESETTG